MTRMEWFQLLLISREGHGVLHPRDVSPLDVIALVGIWLIPLIPIVGW